MTDPDVSAGVRLQKALANAGIASRRRSEQLITAGRVRVNGRAVTILGTRVDPDQDEVRVDGRLIPAPPRGQTYLVLNKPRGVVSTMHDPQGRPNLGQYLGDRPERLFHVGRLDADTEGLLILTNDGDFAQRLTHPSYEISKTYVADVAGTPSRHTLRQLRDGIALADGAAAAEHVRLRQAGREHSMVTITVHEGRNRIVRRMFDAVGHPVRRLCRIAVGPVRLGSLESGRLRELDRTELGILVDATSG
jgi:23S rRNA pseudouridine2605 synthase